MVKKRSGRSNVIRDTGMGGLVRFGFGVGLGSGLAMILFMLVAAIMFVPGFIMVKQEQKKKKEGKEVNMTKLVIGYVLMGLGMIMGLGFGAGTFFSTLGGEF